MFKLRVLESLLVIAIAVPSVLNAQKDSFLSIEADSLWCEGVWVTLTPSTSECATNAIQWFRENPDGSESSVEISDLYAFDGVNLKTLSDGTFIARAICNDGQELSATFELHQALDEDCVQDDEM